MYRKKLELSDSELLAMREAGMTNLDIANSLGVCYKTILRRIGPSDFRKHGERGSVYTARHKPEPEYEACLVVQTEKIKACGMQLEYVIRPAEKRVLIVKDNCCVGVGFDDIGTVVNELTAIQRQLDKLKANNEMW